MKKLLITGSGPHGFVGRNLAESLHGKYHVFAPPSSVLDLRDCVEIEKYLDKHKIDAVIHACSSAQNTLDSDLKMYFNLAKFSSDLEKLIYFGSGAEFDKRFDITNAVEEDIGNKIPVDEYGFAKYIMNEHARHSKNIYNLRLFGIFGKYEDWSYKFISNLCCKAVYDLPLTIRRECFFDFIYIEDLPAVVEWLLESQPKYHDYNFSYGKAVSLTDLADMVCVASRKSLDRTVLDPNEKNKDYSGNNQRLRKEMPSIEITPLQTAICRLYDYYSRHKNEIDFETLKQTR